MLKLLFTGIWVCGVTLAAIYAGAAWRAGMPVTAGSEYLEGLEQKKTRPISVPVVAEGAVQGYITAQLVYTIDAKVAKKLSIGPDVFILDEAFRTIYGDEKLDFRRLEKFDLTKLTKAVTERVNVRFGNDIIKDVLVQEFNYVSLADAQAQR